MNMKWYYKNYPDWLKWNDYYITRDPDEEDYIPHPLEWVYPILLWAILIFLLTILILKDK